MSSKWLLVLTFIAFLQLAVSATLERPGTEVEDVINKNWKPVATNGVHSVKVGEDATALKVDPDSFNVDQGHIRTRPTGSVHSVKVGEDAAELKVDPDSFNVDQGHIRTRPTGSVHSVKVGEDATALKVDPDSFNVDQGRIRPRPVNPESSVGVDSVNGDDEVGPVSNIGTGSNKIDTFYYYRLTNNYSGVSRALDVVNDGRNYALKMAPIGKFTGQFWYFVHLGNNVYNLRTKFLGNKYSLDIVNDGVNDKPHMALTGNYSGQRWRLVRLNDRTFRFHNEFSGNKMFLDVARNTHVPRMFNNKVDYSGQHWFFNPLAKI